MRLLAATSTCLLALMTAAVTVAAAPSPKDHPSPFEFVLLYSRSGGFAPSNRGLTVAPGRFATAEKSTPGSDGPRHVDFHLSVRRIRALEDGLRRAHFASLDSPGPSGCADCFEYAIFYRQNYVKFDQSQVPPRLGSVISQLEAIIAAHLGR